MDLRDEAAGYNRRRWLLASAALLTGCATRTSPPLARLYRNVDPGPELPPLIVIPGAFGSRLRRISTGEEIWPRSNASLLFSAYPNIGVEFDEDTLQPISNDVEAHDIFRAGLGQDFYGAVLDTLEQVGGYRRTYPGQTPQQEGRSFYVYTYDWRLDNIAALEGLHGLIEQIATDHGKPGQQVDILAHSNGGLLARYYARYGTTDVLVDDPPAPKWNGSQRIRRLLMVGTPNFGSMQPVLSHIRGEEIGLRHIPADIVATCSGAPQLMPHPAIACFVNMRGDPLDLDIYDTQTWRELGWSLFNERAQARVARRLNSRRDARRHLAVLAEYLQVHLQRGKRFHASLSTPARPDEPKPYVFGGDCTPTVARVALEHRNGAFIGHERAEGVERPVPGVNYETLLTEPGDGVVTRRSLLANPGSIGQPEQSRLAFSHSVFLCEEHQQLTGNPSFQDNLLYALFNQHS
jgi:pimeloyl-ACP methyl ester carboxylesterase